MDDLSCGFSDDLPCVIVTVPIKDQLGTVYMDIREASRLHKVSRYAIIANLNNKRGYGIVRGMKFNFAI